MRTLQPFEPCLALPPLEAEVGHLLRPTAALPRQPRRLPERILVAAHQACDLGALDTAERLLSVLDVTLARGGDTAPLADRRIIEGMVAAYERLWHLRHRDNPAS